MKVEKTLSIISITLLIVSPCTLLAAGYALFKQQDFPATVILTLLAFTDLWGYFYLRRLRFYNGLKEEAIENAEQRKQVMNNYSATE